MNIDTIIQNIVNNLTEPVLEMYYGGILEPHEYDIISIPEPIEVYVSDYICYDLKLPKTLRVLDLHYWGCISMMSFNMPPNIEDIILRYIDIEDKICMELFPSTSIRYRYVGCKLNGMPLNNIIRDIYFKYFQKEPVCKNKNKLNENIVYYRFHNDIINEIKDYEILIKKVKEQTNIFKEDLIQAVYHPDRVEKGINKYGMEFIDTL